jgi:hypothetical protein
MSQEVLCLRSTQFRDSNRVCMLEAFGYATIRCILDWEVGTKYLE